MLQLKRLELNGFKSFKDKTVIHFAPGITGIVGPNGCGKSNIVDGFFWVMGEQSLKHMRGTKSEDLIFNGSAKYPPLGIAEAVLTLEKKIPDLKHAPSGASAKDAPISFKKQTITITRRLYRKGEGAYFLNGLPVRLKDIRELFLDTGAGTQGYSVIEQGQVEKLISAKAQDRRYLIEEVAGIAKYHLRKKESLRKIALAQTNLARLEDILKEMDRNLHALEKQAQKARKYHEHKKNLSEVETLLGKRKWLLLNRTIEEQEQNIEQTQISLETLTAQKTRLETQWQTLKNQETEKKAIFDSSQQSLQKNLEQITTLKSEASLNHSRFEDFQKEKERLTQEQNSLLEKQTLTLENIKTLQSELSLTKQKQEAIAKNLNTEQKSFSSLQNQALSTETSWKTLQKDFLTSLENTHLIQKEISKKEQKLQLIYEEEKTLLDKKSYLKEKLNHFQKENKEFLLKENTLKTQFHSLTQKQERIQTEIQAIEKKHTFSENQFHIQKAELLALEEKITSHHSLLKNHEGLEDQTRKLFQKINTLSEKNLSVLLDQLEIQHGFETITEQVLSQLLSGIFVKDTAHIEELYHFWEKEKHFGIPFLFLLKNLPSVHLSASSKASLPVFTSPHLEMEFQNWCKKENISYLGKFSDFISLKKTTPSKELSSWNILTQNIFLIKSFSHFPNQFQKLFQKNIRIGIGTKDGIWVDFRAPLPTGQFGTLKKEQVFHIQTKHLVQDWERKKEVLQKDLQEKSAFLKEICTQKNALLEEKTDLEQKTQMIQIRLIRTQETLTHLTQKNKTLTEQNLENQTRENQLKENILSLKNNFQTLEQNLKTALLQKQNLQEELKTTETQTQTIRKKAESSLLKLQETQKLLSTIESQYQTQENKLTLLQKTFQTQKQQESFLKTRLETLEQDLKEKKHFQKKAISLLQEKESIYLQEQEKTLVLKNTLQALQTQLEQIENEKTSLLTKISRTQEQLHAHQLEQERLQSEMTFLKQNLEEKYGPAVFKMPLSPLEKTLPPLTEKEENRLLENIEQIRNRIRRLGEVNPLADKQYDELSKRYEHLLEEKKDLEHSIENLNKAIEHINQISKKRFATAFDSVSKQFECIFPIVFGGGKAKLELTYPEHERSDVFESGIDILVQPPGKKITSIQLLSGGEKALTAICLLFAIFTIKPSPFCILDEVDAPLDDANIGRFLTLVKQLSTKTQFVLITHNKKTMELNNHLYGVTMEEPGVSKMLSVRLSP